jgi:predicted Zn-dependent protease
VELFARYQDGLVATVHEVTCRMEGSGDTATIGIVAAATHRELARWFAKDVYPVPARRDELRIGAAGRPGGARLTFRGRLDVARARAILPALAVHGRLDRGKQLRLLGISTVALASAIAAYIFGVPLLASQIVRAIPAQWERDLGNAVAVQIAQLLAEDGQFLACDENPDSVANRAIARFADAAIAGTGTPFDVSVTVVRSDIPNAFALPGGQVFFFSSLIDNSARADEFAGVLSHEIGHVVHRHSMETLIAGAGTGLLIGFILGDMSGVSVAGALGSTLIDSHFSREAEHVADQFAGSVAQRAAFDPVALADLLLRIAGDDEYSHLVALVSSHPLTSDRAGALAALPKPAAEVPAAFSDAEWQAIRGMCASDKQEPVAPARKPDPGRTGRP